MNVQAKTRKYIYGITVFFIALSGFGQMPVFKRYYIADIPGLSWLAHFYVTHIMHYIAAIVLIAFVIYVLFDFIFSGRGLNTITKTGYFKIVILAGLVVTGSLMVVKNLPGIYFNHNVIIVLDLVHLSFCMFLLGAGFYSLIKKKKWVS